MAVRFTEDAAGYDSDSGAISLDGWLRRKTLASQDRASGAAATPQEAATSTASDAAVDDKQQRLAALRRMITATPAVTANTPRLAPPAPASASAQRDGRKQVQRELQPVTADNAAALLAADTALQEAREVATKHLARKQLSCAELAAVLRRNAVEAAIADTVIAEFTAANYLDDAALAASLVEKLGAAKGNSRQEVRRKLLQRKLSSAVIDSALCALDEQQEAALLAAAAESRAVQLQGLEYSLAKRRLLGYLARRGWGGYAATAAAEAALAAAGIGRENVYFR